MLVADYIAKKLSSFGVRHIFGITGGASLHLMHAVERNNDLELICPHHEQSCAIAADSYSRVTGNLGVAVATSGPGATNLLTGIACSYFDSIPTLFITGQVASFRSSQGFGVRQIGFQETDIVRMVAPISKYAVKLEAVDQIPVELTKAVSIALDERKGPVLVDIPEDFFRAELQNLTIHTPATRATGRALGDRSWIEALIKLVAQCNRPVLVIGAGVRLSGATELVLRLAKTLNFPILTTWGAADIVSGEEPLLVGTFGTHGCRVGNFVIQNSDLILSIGARLGSHETGSPPSSFGRQAKKILVDLDGSELDKFGKQGVKVDLPLKLDAAAFAGELLSTVTEKFQSYGAWFSKIDKWKNNFPTTEVVPNTLPYTDPYFFMQQLSSAVSDNEIVTCDTGCAIAWLMQAFKQSGRGRVIHAFNNTPMGYALPAAIGASLAAGKKRVICIAGDGGMQMNIQELATVAQLKIPIKIFVLNNNGYSMIKQTQEQWLNSEYIGSSPEGGLEMPSFKDIGKAYGLEASIVASNEQLSQQLPKILQSDCAHLCEIMIHEKQRVIPQVKFGRPIEDAEPLLERAKFLKT